VLAAGDAHSGATVHVVNEIFDAGPILLQEQVPVLPGDTLDTLRARVQALEPSLYLRAVQKFLALH
ncbi:MAG: phosphoribosylglycinamide formyltransferase, partial [Pseudomonadales bacterium]|jgi:phosphoribosylglycinamide formyltransferase-1|nr:phosphoribosylglycinamide formyltransferase [Pseudomonadales bacterium]